MAVKKYLCSALITNYTLALFVSCLCDGSALNIHHADFDPRRTQLNISPIPSSTPVPGVGTAFLDTAAVTMSSMLNKKAPQQSDEMLAVVKVDIVSTRPKK
jgi:hypothetical protein